MSATAARRRPARGVGAQRPRIMCAPDEALKSRGGEAIELARSAGLTLDPWQELVLVDGCRVDARGQWAAFEVGANVTRQNGKGGILEARELAGLFVWGERLLTHSAHQFDTSLEAFARLLALIEDTPELDAQVKRVSRSHGEEGITLKSGQRIRYRTRTKGGGRGFSGDLLVFDEAMVLAQFAHGALIPTLSARPNPQVWYAGSAVDQEIHEHGLVFTRLRHRARSAEPGRLAYFEWSLGDEDGADFDSPVNVPFEVASDPAQWAIANPALGIRITADYVTSEFDALDPRSFAVERLGVGDYPAVDELAEAPIEYGDWLKLRDAGSSMLDPVCFAFDVSPDRTASIAAAGRRPDGGLHVEIVEHRPGTRWLAERMAELYEAADVEVVTADGVGPASSVIEAVEDAGVPVEVASTRDLTDACGRMVDAVRDGQLRHLGSLELGSAIRGAKTKPLGDAWAWSRKNSRTDISPLVAATLAVSRAAMLPDDLSNVEIY